MRRSCNALTMLLSCLACMAWAVGPSHSEAKAKPGWAVPIDCGYQPAFDGENLGADDVSPIPVEDQAESDRRPSHHSAFLRVTPAWFGCGGMPAYPCGNFLADRRVADSAPYTYSPYWPNIRPAVAAQRPANPVWFQAATGYDAAYDAALAGKPEVRGQKSEVRSQRTARSHWDAHDDYIACPLGLEGAEETASMAELEGDRAIDATREYTYMSAHDPSFGNDWRDAYEKPLDAYDAAVALEFELDALEREFHETAALVARSRVSSSHCADYRPWNCDRAIADSFDGSAYTEVVAVSSQASQWLILAAARTFEAIGAVLTEMSLTMESAAQSARETASSAINDSCWE